MVTRPDFPRFPPLTPSVSSGADTKDPHYRLIGIKDATMGHSEGPSCLLNTSLPLSGQLGSEPHI